MSIHLRGDVGVSRPKPEVDPSMTPGASTPRAGPYRPARAGRGRLLRREMERSRARLTGVPCIAALSVGLRRSAEEATGETSSSARRSPRERGGQDLASGGACRYSARPQSGRLASRRRGERPRPATRSLARPTLHRAAYLSTRVGEGESCSRTRQARFIEQNAGRSAGRNMVFRWQAPPRKPAERDMIDLRREVRRTPLLIIDERRRDSRSLRSVPHDGDQSPQAAAE